MNFCTQLHGIIREFELVSATLLFFEARSHASKFQNHLSVRSSKEFQALFS